MALSNKSTCFLRRVGYVKLNNLPDEVNVTISTMMYQITIWLVLLISLHQNHSSDNFWGLFFPQLKFILTIQKPLLLVIWLLLHSQGRFCWSDISTRKMDFPADNIRFCFPLKTILIHKWVVCLRKVLFTHNEGNLKNKRTLLNKKLKKHIASIKFSRVLYING